MAQAPHHDRTHHEAQGTVEKVKDGASKALASTREAASDAGRRVSEGIETSPLAVLAGGVALGVLIGAALPRLTKEEELLAPVGDKLAGSAREAIGVAKARGKEELDALGLSRAAAKVQAGKLAEGLLAALTAAAGAAAKVNAARADQDEREPTAA